MFQKVAILNWDCNNGKVSMAESEQRGRLDLLAEE
jgi:hypothetical protein